MLIAAIVYPAAAFGQGAPRWSVPAPLNSYATIDEGSEDTNVKIATDGNNRWVAVWGGTNGVLSALSSDNGATWSSPQVISTSPPASFEQKPVNAISIVYAGQSTFVALWQEDAGTYVSRSLDSGNTWTIAELSVINAVRDADTDSSGTVIVASDTGLFRSEDFGVSWAPIESPGSTSPRKIAYRGDGKWFLASTGGGNFFSTSADNGETWTDPQQLSGPALDIACNGDTLVVASYKLDLLEQNDMANLYFIYSKNGGATWDETPELDSLATRFVADDTVTLDVNAVGNWLVAAQLNQDIAVMQATDPAGPWTPLTVRAAEGGASESKPAVTIDDAGKTLVSYQVLSPSTLYPSDSDIKAIYSTNAGTSWTAPALVNSYGTSDLPTLHDGDVTITFGENGRALATWRVGIAGSMVARSFDYGHTWSAAIAIPAVAGLVPDTGGARASRDSLGFWEGRPFLGYRGDGEWYSVFRYDLGKMFTKSSDHGNTWSSPAPIVADTIAGNRESGTLVKTSVADPNQPTYEVARLAKGASVWSTAATIPHDPAHVIHSGGNDWMLLTRDAHLYVSDNDALSWQETPVVNSPPEIAEISSDGEGTLIAVWNDGEWGNHEQPALANYVSRSTDNGRTWSTPKVLVANQYNLYGAGSVRAASAGDNKWIAVWNSTPGNLDSNRNLACSVSYDDGITWSAPHPCPLEQLFPSDSPVFLNIAAGQNGNVIVSWHRSVPAGIYDFPGEYGYDGDLFYSTAYLNAAPAAAEDWQLFD